jgi:hypothetical protein
MINDDEIHTGNDDDAGMMMMMMMMIIGKDGNKKILPVMYYIPHNIYDINNL